MGREWRTMSKLLLFSKEDCAPCKMVKQMLTSNNIPFEELDVLNDSSEASLYGVMGVPTTILLDSSKNELNRTVGFDGAGLEKAISLLK